MKRIALATLALAACTPAAPPSSTAPAADPLALRYEVRIDQTVLPNVRSVLVTGPDVEVIEVRQGNQPNVAILAPGRIGRIRLDIKTDWAASETTMEAWRATIISPSQQLASPRRTVAVTITSPSGATPATYTFQRCLPTTHAMALGAQPSRIQQDWSVTCESVQRT